MQPGSSAKNIKKTLQRLTGYTIRERSNEVSPLCRSLTRCLILKHLNNTKGTKQTQLVPSTCVIILLMVSLDIPHFLSKNALILTPFIHTQSLESSLKTSYEYLYQSSKKLIC